MFYLMEFSASYDTLTITKAIPYTSLVTAKQRFNRLVREDGGNYMLLAGSIVWVYFNGNGVYRHHIFTLTEFQELYGRWTKAFQNHIGVSIQKVGKTHVAIPAPEPKKRRVVSRKKKA